MDRAGQKREIVEKKKSQGKENRERGKSEKYEEKVLGDRLYRKMLNDMATLR